MTQIDVSKPLELSDGRKVCTLQSGADWVRIKLPDGNERDFNLDGTSRYADAGWLCGRVNGCILRNRQEPQSTDLKLIERALKLVRDLSGACDVSAMTAEARQIVRELDGPKTDEEWASKIAADHGYAADGSITAITLEAIQKGKELQREAGS